MKLNVNIDEDEMIAGIKDMVDNITTEFLPVLFLVALILIVILILTSFCGAALAMYCSKICRFKRVRRRRTFRLKRKTRYAKDEARYSKDPNADEVFL